VLTIPAVPGFAPQGLDVLVEEHQRNLHSRALMRQQIFFACAEVMCMPTWWPLSRVPSKRREPRMIQWVKEHVRAPGVYGILPCHFPAHLPRT
jgi:hypothetical protein